MAAIDPAQMKILRLRGVCGAAPRPALGANLDSRVSNAHFGDRLSPQWSALICFHRSGGTVCGFAILIVPLTRGVLIVLHGWPL